MAGEQEHNVFINDLNALGISYARPADEKMPGEYANSCDSDFRQNRFAYTVNTQLPRINCQKVRNRC